MSEGGQNSGVEPPKLKRKVVPRAAVWKHFTRLPKDIAMCNYCGIEIGCNSRTTGTSPMINHNRKCKMFKDFTESSNSGVIGQDVSGNMKTVKFNPDLFRKSVIQMVVLNELPFSFVESAGFRLFCANMLPLYSPFSRRTAVREIVSMYMVEKAEMKRLFRKTKQRVSLTTDIWVAPTTTYNYMVVTGHWIDGNWELQKKILGFKPITDHKGETIARALIDCLDDWGIERVFTITVDNARGNDRALDVFRRWFSLRGEDALVQGGKYLHMRCCAHVLNLVVRDGLGKVGDSVVAIRNSIKYARSSYARLKSFELRCEEGKVSRGNLTLDCVTRWNSTYLMLFSALKLRNAYERMAVEDKLFCDYFNEEEERGKKRVGPATQSHWEEAAMMVKFLKIFFKSTVVFSASKTVTSTLAYNEIVTIEMNLIKRSKNIDSLISEQAELMKLKFEKYWDGLLNMNPMVIIGSVFDPRNKMTFANACFEKLYGNDTDDYKKLQSIVTKALQALFTEYNMKYGVPATVVVEEQSGGSGIQLDDDLDDDYERMDCIYTQMQSTKRHEVSATELEMYLLERPEVTMPNQLGMDFDVLGWWKHNAYKYPVLSELARDVLAVQVTSVASESAFSTSGRILDPYRSALTPFMVEVLICSQQWLRSRNPNVTDIIPTLEQMHEEADFFDSLDPGAQDT